MTYAAGDGADQDLAILRFVDLDIFNSQGWFGP